jgi:DNA-binding response OmpR family regulator
LDERPFIWRERAANRRLPVRGRFAILPTGPDNGFMRVLVVEDDPKTATFVSRALTDAGSVVDVLGNGDEALSAIGDRSYDVVVLDIMLPGRDGLSVVRQLRSGRNRTPVLLLSARGAVDERVEGLDAGADDYLAKPFELEELIARVRALGRRAADSGGIALRVGDLTLDTATRTAQRGGHRIELTAKEFGVLEVLMRSAGRICGRMTILEKVWNYDFDPGSNIVDVYVRRLRSKIDEGFDVKLLNSVRGVGYVMKGPE